MISACIRATSFSLSTTRAAALSAASLKLKVPVRGAASSPGSRLFALNSSKAAADSDWEAYSRAPANRHKCISSDVTRRMFVAACVEADCSGVFAPRWLPAALEVRVGLGSDLLCPECSNAALGAVSDVPVKRWSLHVLSVTNERSRNIFVRAADLLSWLA